MTEDRPMEKIIDDLEGATQALNNFAQSDDLTIETEHGLKWLALQIDVILVELRQNWDAANPRKEDNQPLKAVEE